MSKIPPQNLEAESSLLGALLIDKEAIIKVGDALRPADFYKESHGLIYQAILDLFEKHEPADILSVGNRLAEKKQLDGVGGKAYLAELTAGVPNSSHVVTYSEIIRKKSTLRKLERAASEISEFSFSEDQDVSSLLDRAEQKLFSISQESLKKNFIPIKSVLTEAFNRIDELHKSGGKGTRGIPSGFSDLDNKLSGFQNSDLIILAARPSLGKTTLALDIARMSATKNDKSILIFSLEMSSQQLVDRMLSAESRVNAWNLRTGHLSSDKEFSQIRDSLDKLAKAKIYIDDQPGNSIVRMKALARRLKAEKGLDLIVVDYLQLMTTSKNYDSMVNQVTEISRSLKSLAKELDVPVLALSQLSRAVEARGGKPRLSDLRDSGSIEQDADVVMFIHREDKGKEKSEKNNIAEILIEKHRNGPTGKIELHFDEKTTTFLNLEKSNISEFAPSKIGGELDEF